MDIMSRLNRAAASGTGQMGELDQVFHYLEVRTVWLGVLLLPTYNTLVSVHHASPGHFSFYLFTSLIIAHDH